MKKPGSKAASRAAIIVLALLVAYFAFGGIALTTALTSNWLGILVVLAIVSAIAIPFIDIAFGDKLPFHSNWSTLATNSRIRHFLGFLFSRNKSPQTAKTGKQVAVSMLWIYSPFLALLALAGAVSLFRPVSDTLATLPGFAFMGSTATAATQFLSFRLSMKYDLKSAFLAIAIYAPVVIVATSASLVWHEILDDGPFRIPRDLFLFVCCFGIFITALMALLPFRKQAATAPTFTAHYLYRRAEIATSLASLTAASVIFLLSS